MTEPTTTENATYRDEDWYGEDLSGLRFINCTFSRVDLSEVVARGA